MNKASLENELRVTALDVIMNAMCAHYDLDRETQICQVSASEFAIPVTDAEGNDKFVLVKVSIPRGTRNGTGGYDDYDGYALAEEYREECAGKKAKREASAAKKAAAEAERKRKAEAKKTVKELNAKGLNAMIHEGEGE